MAETSLFAINYNFYEGLFTQNGRLVFRRFIFSISVAFSLILTAFPSDQSTNPDILRERHTGIMGTDLHLSVIGTNKAYLDQIIDDAITEMKRIEDLMTDWRPSPLTTLNQSVGLGPHKVPNELTVIISHGIEMSNLTNGAFDITYAGIGQLWTFKHKMTTLPDPKTIRDALLFVNYKAIALNLSNSTVSLPSAFKIGLGGIAKGYAIDQAMTILIKNDIKHAIINAGGDMKILGKKFNNPWEIAIKHPRDQNKIMARLKLSNVAVVTSGDYERFFEINRQRYHHIIDPRTGYPSNGCLSATVVAPEAEFADALATGLCVMKPKDGLNLVESLKQVDAILVGMDGIVRASTGLKKSLR